MIPRSQTWQPQWKLRPDEILSTEDALKRLDYCLQWRAWLWRKPAMQLLCPFERFRGKRVLEIGFWEGYMSCLLAAAGADVTGVDLEGAPLETAQKEAKKWGVEARTHLGTYDGNYENLPVGPFDVIFTKSTLVMTDKRRLDDLYTELQKRLAPGGVCLFLENCNNWILDKIRWYIVHREVAQSRRDYVSWGFSPQQVAKIGEVFGSMQAKQRLWLVWSIQAGGTLT